MVMHTKEATQDVVKVRRAGAEMASAAEVKEAPTIEEVRAHLQARLKSVEDELMARTSGMAPKVEFAELQPWWDILALGPIQTPPFFQPSNVIQIGETAFIASIVVVNPIPFIPPGISPLTLLTGVNADIEIRYRTGNLDTWTPTAPSIDSVVPVTGVFNLDVQPFVSGVTGVMDMSISARITTPGPGTLPFGGFASLLLNLDSEPLLSLFGLPGASPAFTNRVPLRYSVYQPG